MKRAESLARLHDWAEALRPWEGKTAEFLDSPARSHGLAAVRAIREASKPTAHYRFALYAVSEARSAVHAALDAVGLKTL